MWRDEMECAVKVHNCHNGVGGSGQEEGSKEWNLKEGDSKE